jgi:hypothetical protein
LIAGLAEHDGIAFILVTSAQHGAMVIGATGVSYLDDDRIEGEDPLAGYGPNAARHLRRHNLFSNCPDILVNGRFDEKTGEVAAFEETIGSHGGLGGTQSRPFLLYPSMLHLGASLIGTRELHGVFARWQQELGAAVPPPNSSLERVG